MRRTDFFFTFPPRPLRWVLAGARYVPHPTGWGFLFGAFPFLPAAKMGCCGGLIEIVQEKPAKVFPAHTLFLATTGKNSLPNTVAPLRFAAFAKSRKTWRILESNALHPPQAALALLSTHARSAFSIRGRAGFPYISRRKNKQTPSRAVRHGRAFSHSMILRTISSAGSISGRLVRFASASLK